ncbi:putative salt tolerance-like protein [Carex littledalei]|uniref:Putative salt tolerance-like protein n=1 Tax=Carex littledalei TaxID=544730 RepID=A0A833QML9_9POAL|nr:putative salt tolerance-like protein [Carex littledalei]
MKVQCDGCGTEAASVFCCADEAALCDTCDRRVHRANKLASKHRRFSLLHPSSLSSSSAQPPPLCDICQDKRGFLFCKEDRAILCRDCDVPIHTSSDLTKKHTRFLLTGVRLSSAPITAGSAPSEIIEQEAEKQTITESNSYSSKAISQEEARSCTGTATSNNSSSISNYLINMLPGWQVDELLSGEAATGGVPTNAPFTSFSSNGFYQVSD